MNRKLISTAICIICLIVSCRNYTPNDRQILKQAGTNRSEIRKLLIHAHTTHDTLQRKAILYILNHSQHHEVINSEKNIPDNIITAFHLMDSVAKNYCNEFDKRPLESSCKDILLSTSKTIHELLSEVPQPDSNSTRIEFIKTIKYKPLINHINVAIDNWKHSVYSKNLSENDFYETLLRYRYFDEKIELDNHEIQKLFKTYITDRETNSPEQIIKKLNYYLRTFRYINDSWDPTNTFGFYHIIQWNGIGCIDQSVVTAQILNACGIPSRIDFNTHWLNRNIRHYWVSIWDTSGQWLPFSPEWQPLHDNRVFQRSSKVYQASYAPNPNSAFYKKASVEAVPRIFDNPLMSDISQQYHHVTNLEIPYTLSDSNNLAYLSIFTPEGFTPVAWGEVKKKRKVLQLKNIPVGVVYFPTTYTKNGRSIPFAKPFYLSKTESIKEISPNWINTTSLILTSKRPQKTVHLKKWLDALTGSWFEGANNPDFSDAVTLYRMNMPPMRYVQEVSTLNNGPFRYVRCVTGHNDEMNMAVMEYLTRSDKDIANHYGTLPHVLHPKYEYLWEGAKQHQLLQGKLIGDIEDLEGGFDGKMLTCTVARWAGIDFGEPQKVDKIRFAGRNADNMIVPGNTYKLLMYDGKWIELGTKIAEYNYLQFNDVPSEAIYWLRNLTTGKEELSFFYSNGHQIFINHDDMEEIEFLN